MLEINRLYRIIGRCEQQLARLQAPKVAPATTEDTTADVILDRYPILKSTTLRVVLVIVVLGGVVYLFRRRSQ